MVVIKSKKLKESSKKWIKRQLSDPYVKKSKQENYRSRAAYKIIEIDNKYKLLKRKQNILELGAAPGSWTQAILRKLSNDCNLVAVDIIEISSLPNAKIIVGDFLEDNTIEEIKKSMPYDVILSDMAPSTTGIKKVDHLKIMNLVESVFEVSKCILKKGGHIVVKVFQGGAEASILSEVKKKFKKVCHFKPPSSRKESSEIYLICKDLI